MTIKVAINGFGRIGRNILRAHYEDGKRHDLQIVAVNDLGDAKTNAHLLQYDTAHGKFPAKVEVDGGALVVNGDRIRVCAERDPARLPWKEMGIDVVFECTGLFTGRGANSKAAMRPMLRMSTMLGMPFSACALSSQYCASSAARVRRPSSL